MTAVYCSQGHHNPPDSRFCHLCGEKILVPTQAFPINHTGLILGDRYRIVAELGSGGFGRTYLVEDINRFNERCVLKEFTPQARGTFALQKAEELFEREAGVLYKLNHPQIPRFRELFRATLDDRQRLFLVQEYAEGQTYRQLLDARLRTGICFSSAEIRQFLEQLLPVLHYIHSNGVVHRDIAPDNLICRSIDHCPVLIDFGGVKQIAAATSQYVASGDISFNEFNGSETPKLELSIEAANPLTRLGKVGYAPPDQMLHGIATPQSDLYALAMTCLVLLTGNDPQTLLQNETHTPEGLRSLSLEPLLTQVLRTMLTAPTTDQPPSAHTILQLLSPAFPLLPTTQLPPSPIPLSPHPPIPPSSPITTPITAAVQPAVQPAVLPAIQSIHSPTKPRRLPLVLTLILLPCAILSTAAWFTQEQWLPLIAQVIPQLAPLIDNDPIEPDDPLTARRETLGVDEKFLIALTDATFYNRYPDQQGRSLSDEPDDSQWRLIWASIADDWLSTLEELVSPEARRQLGRYSEADRTRWKEEVNQLYVGSRSLFDLTDARFFRHFPEQRQQNFIDQPIGQIWQAMAADQVALLKEGVSLEKVRFTPGTFSHQLDGNLVPGAGRVYIANLSEQQVMRVNLQATPREVLLSIYPPRPTKEIPALLEDSTDTTWADRLPQSGYYEVVIVSQTNEPIQYRLNLAVDNVSSQSVEPPDPESPAAKD